MFHPIYGELMTAKEVAEATHFTLNQLRNWRNDSRAHLAPFGSIQIGGTSYYRKIVVQDYLDEQGPQSGNYRMTDRDKKFPLNESVSAELGKIDAINTVSRITTENVMNWLETQLDKNISFIDTWKATWAELGEEYISKNDASTNYAWYPSAVQTQRLFVSNAQGLGLTVEDIKAIPVGAVPPLNEKK